MILSAEWNAIINELVDLRQTISDLKLKIEGDPATKTPGLWEVVNGNTSKNTLGLKQEILGDPATKTLGLKQEILGDAATKTVGIKYEIYGGKEGVDGILNKIKTPIKPA